MATHITLHSDRFGDGRYDSDRHYSSSPLVEVHSPYFNALQFILGFYFPYLMAVARNDLRCDLLYYLLKKGIVLCSCIIRQVLNNCVCVNLWSDKKMGQVIIAAFAENTHTHTHTHEPAQILTWVNVRFNAGQYLLL